MIHRVCTTLSLLIVVFYQGSMVASAAEGLPFVPPPDWLSLLQIHQERLEQIDSDQSALDFFSATLGPAIGLQDVAATLTAKGLPARLSNELLIPEITRSAQRLVAAMSAWQLSDRLNRSISASTAGSAVTSPVRVDWLAANGPFASLSDATSRSEPQDGGNPQTAVAVAAGRLAQEAAQQVMAEWWRLKSWKDRVRLARGQARLCGSWQWAIHNHQKHHQEQKLSLIFPPPGKEGTGIPGLTEIVVLGDVVYLRWEMDGRTQEDSLMFSKEGQRLEGTFVNSQGGWGSISGKRTASCTLQ